MTRTFRIIEGDALAAAKGLPGESVQCVVTSPPYFNARDYGTGRWDGGDANCDHVKGMARNDTERETPGGKGGSFKGGTVLFARECGKCGARRVDSQIGLELTPALYVARLVEVFREVRRVLRKDGTLWLNVGDSYANDSKWGGSTGGKHAKGLHGQTGVGRNKVRTGLPPKSRMGIPHRLVFALQDDGWLWRDEIVWHKPSTMTESVRDRCTRAHEFVFMLTKAPNYFYDRDAIAEPAQDWGERDRSQGKYTSGDVPIAGGKHHGLTGVRAQKRRALELAAEKGLTPDHLAAIRAAGMTDAGKAQATQLGFGKNTEEVQRLAAEAKEALGGYYREFLSGETRNRRSVWSVSPKPSREDHYAAYPPDLIEPCILAGSREGDTVYDPFGGSGTTALVALRLNRNAILSELNPDYVQMARRRILNDAPLLNTEAA